MRFHYCKMSITGFPQERHAAIVQCLSYYIKYT